MKEERGDGDGENRLANGERERKVYQLWIEYLRRSTDYKEFCEWKERKTRVPRRSMGLSQRRDRFLDETERVKFFCAKVDQACSDLAKLELGTSLIESLISDMPTGGMVFDGPPSPT